VLNAHEFRSLEEVREIIHEWLIVCNEERSHAALNYLPPAMFKRQLNPTPETSTFQLSA